MTAISPVFLAMLSLMRFGGGRGGGAFFVLLLVGVLFAGLIVVAIQRSGRPTA